MSHPIVWMFDTMFYPLGNTPALCLTQDLSPEQDAEILLLGCGDPRNLLYTLYVDLTTKDNRKIDATCCDMEPAVLARNGLLFALIEQDVAASCLWDIFFHFKINKSVASQLTATASKLSEASTTIEDWKRSKWSSYMKPVDLQTLSALRRHWKFYATFFELPPSKIDGFRREHSQLSKRFTDTMGQNAGIGRSAGIFWADAMTPMAKLFEQYWDNGTTFISPDDIKSATELNPTFGYSMSGERFKPHYGTFPQGFHFAPAFAPVLSSSNNPANSDEGDIIPVAKQQFSDYCQAFRRARSANSITIRFFSGEATTFCRALDIYSKTGQAKTGIFTCQWRASEIDFSDCMPMPLEFDVVDTSNLLDHLGPLNVLITTQPLLKKRPASQSVLYMEALLPSGKDATQSLSDRFCADVPTIAILFGLAPRAYLSAFTTQSNVHEIIVSAAFKQISQYHERVAWVSPASGNPNFSETGPVSLNAVDLSNLLLGIYVKMFKDEQITPELRANPTAAAAREMSQAHYHRESFALLLRLVRNRVQMSQEDWEEMVNRLLSLITSNKESMLEMDHYQDLCLQLHLYGLFTVSSLHPNWQLVPRVGVANLDIFEGWDDIPPVVCVVATIPRKSLGALMNESAGSPRFQMNMMGGSSYHNNYSSLHGIWGTCVRNSNDSSVVSIEEDPEGIHGTSDLVVSFWASPYLLVTANTTVCFALRPNPFTISQFMRKLGVNMVIFKASLEDRKYVTIMRNRPMGGSAVQRVSQLGLGLSLPQPDPKNVSLQIITVKEERTKFTYNVASIIAKLSIVSPGEQIELLNGASVSAKQISPCAMEVSVGDFRHDVAFPYPINGAGHRLRVARKSHYIEVISNVAAPIGPGGYSLNTFPILGYGSYTPWNIHHINLDRMPLLDFKYKKKLEWLKTHCMFQLSDRERALSEAAKNKPENVMVQVKESIYTMFTHCSGLEGGPTKAFCFCEPSGNLGVYTVALVAGTRLDLASSTVVLDAAIVPLSLAKMPTLLPGIQSLHSRGKEVEQLITHGAEVVAWKHLLPALVERCRTWSHTPNSRFVHVGKGSASTLQNGTFRGGKDFFRMQRESRFHPYSQYRTSNVSEEIY